MGALDELQSFVQTKILRQKKKNDDSANNAASPGQGDTTHGIVGGFPFMNYASERVNLRPLMVPRQKYTYMVEFHVNEDALLDGIAVTNLKKFLNNGNMYTQLKRIDHPKPSFAVETLRSYNKYVKLPTKMEFPAASMTFDDDTTSITAALIKEYINFYSHSGDVGSVLLTDGNTSKVGPVRPPNFNTAFGSDAFSFDQPNVGYNHLITNAETDEPRSHMNSRHSMGLKLKPNYKRHFFNSIVIYDLGTEPNSVNIYYFHRPVFTAINHDGLDTEDRTSKVEVTVNFEYENYYFALGRSTSEVADAVELLTGVRPPDQVTSDLFDGYHGKMEDQKNNSVPVSKTSPNPMTPMPETTTPQVVLGPGNIVPPNLRPPSEIEDDIETVRGELTEISTQTASGSTPEQDARKTALNNKLEALNAELNQSVAVVSERQKTEQAAPATQSAVENTKKQMAAADAGTPEQTMPNPSNLIVNGRNRDQWQDIHNRATVMHAKLNAEADSYRESIEELERNGGALSDIIAIRELEIQARQGANDQAELKRLATESVIEIDETENRPFRPL